MFVRRLSTFAIASALALAITVPAVAQDEGNTITVNLTTCAISGGLPSITIADTANPSGVGHDCVEGWEDGRSMTLNGAEPSDASPNVLVWTDVASGDASFAASVAAMDGAEIVVEGDTTLAATLFISDLPPAAEEDYPSATATATETDPAAASSTADDETTGTGGTTTTTSTTASSLPKTGSGPEGTAGIGLALAAAAGIAAVGARQARRRA